MHLTISMTDGCMPIFTTPYDATGPPTLRTNRVSRVDRPWAPYSGECLGFDVIGSGQAYFERESTLHNNVVDTSSQYHQYSFNSHTQRSHETCSSSIVPQWMDFTYVSSDLWPSFPAKPVLPLEVFHGVSPSFPGLPGLLNTLSFTD